MLRRLKDLLDRPVSAEDGEIGVTKGFFFDDRQWVVRYVIVETPSKPHLRETIISTAALKNLDWESGKISTDLWLAQVWNGPGVDLESPPDIAQEERIARYYGWPVYWNALGTEVHRPTVMPSGGRAMVVERESTLHALRSTRGMVYFGVRTIDGEIGEITDFLADEASWKIRYFEVDSCDFMNGRRVLLSPDWADAVEWHNHTVEMPLSKSTVKESPAYDPASPVTRDYENKLFDHYKMPKYWRR